MRRRGGGGDLLRATDDGDLHLYGWFWLYVMNEKGRVGGRVQLNLVHASQNSLLSTFVQSCSGIFESFLPAVR